MQHPNHDIAFYGITGGQFALSFNVSIDELDPIGQDEPDTRMSQGHNGSQEHGERNWVSRV